MCVCVRVCFEGEGDLITFDKSKFLAFFVFPISFWLDRFRHLLYLLSRLILTSE